MPDLHAVGNESRNLLGVSHRFLSIDCPVEPTPAPHRTEPGVHTRGPTPVQLAPAPTVAPPAANAVSTPTPRVSVSAGLSEDLAIAAGVGGPLLIVGAALCGVALSRATKRIEQARELGAAHRKSEPVDALELA